MILACDPTTLEHLKELSSKRRMIEESINQTSSFTEAIAREMSRGLTSRWEQKRLRLEQYLPLLQNFIYHAGLPGNTSQMGHWTSQLKIRWSRVLGSSSFFSLAAPKFFQIDNLRFELGMVLFLYGAILWERALELIPSDLKQSAFIFREAAGVYHYLAHEVLPSLQLVISAERSPEASSSISAALSLICLAQAQAVYIRKAEEMGSTGFGVLAKLHHGIAELLSEATGSLSSSECKSISSHLLEYISSCRALHELRSWKYLAEGLKNDSQVGVAIGVLRDALTNMKKKTPGNDSWKTVFNTEIKLTPDNIKKFEHENDFVWHEKVSSGDELPSPQGIRIVKIEPYDPPILKEELAFKIQS